MIWRDRWFQIYIVTKPWTSGAKTKKYLIGNVTTKTKNAIKMACTVDFDDTYTGLAANARITITGLSSRTLYLLSSEIAQYIQDPHYSYVEVCAGYSNCHGVIYKGSIMSATPDMNGPDYKITLDCDGFADVDNAYPISTLFKGKVDVRTILRSVASQANLTFEDKTFNKLLPLEVEDFNCNNMCVSQICCMLMQQSRKFIIHIEKGNKTIWSGFNVSIDEDLSGGKIVLLDADTSVLANGTIESKVKKVGSDIIVGSPTLTALGCKVRTRFKPDIVGGEVVRVYSSRYPKLKNFKFIVNRIGVHLDTKGNTWYKDLELVYPGLDLVGKPDVYGDSVWQKL